jgi:hypothetical protein
MFALKFIGIVVAGFAFFIILMALSDPRTASQRYEDRQAHQTKYQNCMENRSHMRDDPTTQSAMQAFCDQLPVEKADLK